MRLLILTDCTLVKDQPLSALHTQMSTTEKLRGIVCCQLLVFRFDDCQYLVIKVKQPTL